MKKIINDPKRVVDESVAGFALAHADLVTVATDPIHVVRADAPVAGKVGIVSGGGSGHEPLHAGYVGHGMLDAAVPGAVFTSPTPDPILNATKAVDGGKGVLHIVKNYTGDVLNFEMAAELAEAEGIPVKTVLVADDVAVEDSTWTAGRRGVGTTVLVEKIAGAAAEEGADLEAVHAIATRVSESGRSMGVALTSATLPSVGKPSFDLPEDEIEMGVGIHGEPGRRREPLRPAAEIAEQLVSSILADHDFTGAPVIAMLSGLGGTPLIELYLMYGDIAALLEQRGVTVARTLVGDYITSLDMAGCSLTLLRADDELLRLWDAPVGTPALRWGV